MVVRWMTREPVIQWSNSEREKTNTVYMKSRKTVLLNLFAGREWRCRYREWTCGHTRGKGRVGRSSPLYYIHFKSVCVSSSINRYILKWVKQIGGEKLLYNTGNSAWSSLMMYRGEIGGVGRHSKGGEIYIHTHMTDLHFCMAETNTTL